MDTTEGFAGEQELVSKFGLEIREDTTFTVSKRRWEDIVGDPATQIVSDRPNEGDIIYMPLMNSFFEILFVEDQEPFFQLGNLPVYKLRVTRFEYSSERLDTGVADIDAAEDKFSLDMLAHQMTLEAEEGSLLLENDRASGDPNYFLMETYAIQTQSPYANNIDMDNEAGFDTASVGNSQTSRSLLHLSTIALAVSSAMTRSTDMGKCGPCCSIAPTGNRIIDDSDKTCGISGPLRSSYIPPIA